MTRELLPELGWNHSCRWMQALAHEEGPSSIFVAAFPMELHRLLAGWLAELAEYTSHLHDKMKTGTEKPDN